MNEQVSNGYIHKSHKIEHKVFGAANEIGGTPLMQSGNWSDYLPALDQQQNVGVEPDCCVSEATKGVFEILAKMQFGDTREWSARFLAWVSGTGSIHGNDPMTVLNALKKFGIVLETDWPNTSALTTWDEFYAVPPKAIQLEALEYPAEYEVDGEWVNPDPISMMAALQYSPLTGAGYAWAVDGNGLYETPPGSQPCHDFIVYDAVENVKWLVLDSYSFDLKELEWNYVFIDVMRYSLVKNTGNTPAEQSAWQSFLSYMQEIISKTLGVGDYSPERTMGAARSEEWPKVRREFAKYVPMVCPFSGKTTVQLHHSRAAFHTDASRELDPTQLRWVAQGYHLEEGHNGDFKSLNFTFDERLDEYQSRKYWNGSEWVANDKPRIKYKLTPEELLEWNKTFGTNWVYPESV